MLHYNKNSDYNNLKLCFDSANKKSWDGAFYWDLVTGKRSDNIGDPSWFNNIGFMTISIVVEWYAPGTGYAYLPISKYNATLENASMTLYIFGNWQGNGSDGVWNFIAGNGGWGGIGIGGNLTLGSKHHIVLQYNNQTGGQTWFNGTKNGGRSATGILGNSHTASTSVVNFNTNANGNGHDKMHHLSIWNKELSDADIILEYNTIKRKYGVV